MANWFCSSVKWTAVTAWAANTVLGAGAIRRQVSPTAGNERVFRTAVGGTTHATTEPVWVLTKGGTSPTDGTITDWTEITGSSTYNTLGGTYSAPLARLARGAAWMAVTDTLYVLNDHAESGTGAALTQMTFPGSLTQPNLILGVDSGGALATGASMESTGTDIQFSGHFYMYGIQHKNSNTNSISYGQSASNIQVYEQCTEWLNTGGGNSRIYIGTGSNNSPTNVTLINHSFKFGNTGHKFVFLNCLCEIRGVTLLSGGTSPTGVFSAGDSGRMSNGLVVSGLDLTNASAGVHILADADGAANCFLRVRDSKMPASWSGGPTATNPTIAGTRVELTNVDSADTHNRSWVRDIYGDITTETTIIETSPNGASDYDAVGMSWKMVSSANANFPTHVLRTMEIGCVPNTAVGSSKTVTVDFVHDSVTALNNDEIWLEVEYLGTSGRPLAAYADNRRALLASPAAQSSSTATWTNSMANPNKQQLAVTFTPQEAGVYMVRVCLAKASYTLYVNPVGVIS